MEAPLHLPMETRAVMLREFPTSWQSAAPPEPRRSDAPMENGGVGLRSYQPDPPVYVLRALGSGVFAGANDKRDPPMRRESH